MPPFSGDTYISELGNLAEILILARILLSTGRMIMSQSSRVKYKSGRQYYRVLVIVELTACQVSCWIDHSHSGVCSNLWLCWSKFQFVVSRCQMELWLLSV